MSFSYDDEWPPLPDNPENYEPHSRRLIRRDGLSVQFGYSWCKHYFIRLIYPECDDYVLSSEMTDWLRDNGGEYKVEFDRGDWGAGMPIADIKFTNSDCCDAFVEQFDHTVNFYFRKNWRDRDN